MPEPRNDPSIYRKTGTADLDLPAAGFDFDTLVGWQAQDVGPAPIQQTPVIITAFLGMIGLEGTDEPVPLLMVENDDRYYIERLWTELQNICAPDKDTPFVSPYVQAMHPLIAEIWAGAGNIGWVCTAVWADTPTFHGDPRP